MGIGAVLTLNEDHELAHLGGLEGYLELLRSLGFEATSIPIGDFGVPTLGQAREAVSWIERMVSEGRAVLVHCKAGLGRSCLVAACYLIHKYGYDAPRAIEEVRVRRPGSLGSPLQVAFVLRFGDYVRRSRGRP